MVDAVGWYTVVIKWGKEQQVEHAPLWSPVLSMTVLAELLLTFKLCVFPVRMYSTQLLRKKLSSKCPHSWARTV